MMNPFATGALNIYTDEYIKSGNRGREASVGKKININDWSRPYSRKPS